MILRLGPTPLLRNSIIGSSTTRDLHKYQELYFYRFFTCSATQQWREKKVIPPNPKIPLPHEPDSFPLSAKLRNVAFEPQRDIIETLDHISAGFRFRQNSFQWRRVQRASIQHPNARDLILAYALDIARRTPADAISPLSWNIVKGIILPGRVPSPLESSLRLFNGVFQWHISQGVHPSRDFVGYGLVLAINCRNATAISQYLELARASNSLAPSQPRNFASIPPILPRR